MDDTTNLNPAGFSAAPALPASLELTKLDAVRGYAKAARTPLLS